MPNRVEQMEAYLKNKMSQKDKSAFEKALATDKSLHDEFNIYLFIEKQMQNKEKYFVHEESLKSSLNKLNDIYFGTKKIGDMAGKRRLGFSWKWMAAAAALTGIILFTAIRKLNKGENNHYENLTIARDIRENLFIQNFKPDKLPEEQEGPLQAAFDLYANRQYRDALERIEKVDYGIVTRGAGMDSATAKLYATYYMAQCNMALGDMARALPQLVIVLKNSAGDKLQTKAKWYLALAYLKTGDIQKSVELLKEMAGDTKEMEYKNRAKNLLEQLK